jgi:hypothetical protein
MKDKSTKNKNRNKKNVNTRKKTSSKKNKKQGRQLSVRGVTTIIVTILLMFMILIILISSAINKNNIEKVYAKLDDNIGNSISDVEKSTKVEFYQSASNELLANLTKFNYITESSTNIRVCGVKTPKWVIYAKINKLEEITQFTVYNFQILEDNVLGVEVADHINTTDFVGISESSLLDSMGMQPYISTIAEDGSKTLYFRYYYRDTSSKNDTSIQLCVNVDSQDTVTAVAENNIDFISKVLSLEDVSQTQTDD